jgi:nucleoside-diphosphate-sugar epimerase
MRDFPLAGRRILVTGASGFIGSCLCRRLLQNGAALHGVSRKKQTNDTNSMTWWQGDLSEISAVRNIIGEIKPDIVFHLASHVVGARELDVVLPTFYSNLATTINLLTVASEIGCDRIVLVGSLEEPDETDIIATPCSPYAAAKWACSGYARMFHALYETPVSIARLFMVYGPGQQDLKKLIPYVILSLLRGEAPELTTGQRQVDWIYVDDVVDGLLAMALAEDTGGQSIEIGSGAVVSIAEVVRQLVEILDPTIEPLFGAIPDRPMEQIRAARIDYTYDMIGWRASTSLQEGLRYTVDWYREKLLNRKGL